MLRNRTVNTALLLVAITRRRAVVGCHAVLFLYMRASSRMLYCEHLTQYSHLVLIFSLQFVRLIDMWIWHVSACCRELMELMEIQKTENLQKRVARSLSKIWISARQKTLWSELVVPIFCYHFLISMCSDNSSHRISHKNLFCSLLVILLRLMSNCRLGRMCLKHFLLKSSHWLWMFMWLKQVISIGILAVVVGLDK